MPSLKKRFYQVKVKSLGTTSLKELGQLMGQLQRQAFRKDYGKIWDLAMVEVSTYCLPCPVLWSADKVLHIWGLPASADCERVWRNPGMPTRRKEAISFLWVQSLHDKSCQGSENLSRVGPCKAKQEWGSWSTKEVFGGKGKGLGKSKQMGFLLLTSWHFWSLELSSFRIWKG